MRWRSWLVAGTVVLVATVAVVAIFTSGGSPSAAAAQRAPVSTATVQRRELTATVSESGVLTYRARADGSPYSVINQVRGIYTKLPAIGQVVRQGQVLYRTNDLPVVLLYGATPAYRTLSAGMTGPDVAELNTDLVALGYAVRAQFGQTPAAFGSATTAAVEKLQAAEGLNQTGTLALGQALFEPTAVRVTAVTALLGASAQPGQTTLQGTSSTRQVQVALDTSEQTDVAVGDTVTITLPNNRTISGVVSSVGKVATCPSTSGSGGSTANPASTATGTCSSGSIPTINVDIAPSHPDAMNRWDQAAVQVGITTARVPGALVVPLNALLARSQGGYAVEVAGAGERNRLVPVSLGLFDDADGTVQVTGSRLAVGQKVVVPAT